MLTVSDALQMEEFAGAKVVAGHEGLSRPVAWVHVAGVNHGDSLHAWTTIGKGGPMVNPYLAIRLQVAVRNDR